MEPDHFYIATFKEVNASQTTDTEPIYMTVYTIHKGPFGSVEDAWEAAWLEDDQWNSALVLGFKGVNAVHAYHEIYSDTPTENALDATSAEDALFSKVSDL